MIKSNPRIVVLWVVLVLLLLLLLWFLTLPREKETTQGNDRFGLNFVSAPDHLADETRYQGTLASGARWTRWPLYWHWVDQGGYVGRHTGGQHDYDTLVAQDIAHGLTPLAILMGTPARYAQAVQVTPALSSTSPNKPASLPLTVSSATLPPTHLDDPIFSDGSDTPGPGKAINPANLWASFVYTTAQRYRPQGVLAQEQGWPAEVGVRHWEIWNEPDYRLFWNGTVEQYHRLLEVAYKSIKTADPEATVLLGGLAFYEQRDWFPSLLRQANGQADQTYFELFSFHHYLSIYQSEALIRQARATLDSFGLAHVPIWITESGVAVWDDYPATAHNLPADAPYRATMMEQAAYVVENSALAFYHGVKRYYHFMLHDDCGDGPGSAFGLRQNFSPHVCGPAQGLARPAYAAYQVAATQFRELLPLWRSKQYQYDTLAFYRPGDRSRVLVMWARQGLTVTTTISATGPQAQLYWVEPHQTISGTTGLSRSLTLTPTNGVYNLTLAPATNQNGATDEVSYQIGGPPLILVEADTKPPQTKLNPLPPASPANFVVSWQGSDLGSSIAGYEVWMSQDDQPLQLWLTDTRRTEARFSGEVGHAYGFAVRARDQAGNQEAAPLQSQAITQIVAGPALGGVVMGPLGEPIVNAAIAISGPNTQETVATDSSGQWLPVALRPGDYTVQAQASGYGQWPAPRHITLTETPTVITTTLAPAMNVVMSGDFEGNEVWNYWDWTGQVNLSIDAFDGQAAARLGDGQGEPTQCSDGQAGRRWAILQSVTTPSEGRPAVSFLYKISATQVASPSAWLEVSVLANNKTYLLDPPGRLTQPTNWSLAWADLGPWRGQSVLVQWAVTRCTEQSFSATLDRVSVGPQ
jgi:hypothetical protein